MKARATVILLGRTMQKLEAVYDSIEAAGSPQPAIFPMNLEGATNHDYAELASKLGEEFGALDGLLHNAAELRFLSRADDYDLEHWYRVMQVNLNGPFMMTQACLPLMRKSQDASIVFTSDSCFTRFRNSKCATIFFITDRQQSDGLFFAISQASRQLQRSA